MKIRCCKYNIEVETHGSPHASYMHDAEVDKDEPTCDDQAAGLASPVRLGSLTEQPHVKFPCKGIVNKGMSEDPSKV